jgi:hypothetical protein
MQAAAVAALMEAVAEFIQVALVVQVAVAHLQTQRLVLDLLAATQQRTPVAEAVLLCVEIMMHQARKQVAMVVQEL